MFWGWPWVPHSLLPAFSEDSSFRVRGETHCWRYVEGLIQPVNYRMTLKPVMNGTIYKVHGHRTSQAYTTPRAQTQPREGPWPSMKLIKTKNRKRRLALLVCNPGWPWTLDSPVSGSEYWDYRGESLYPAESGSFSKLTWSPFYKYVNLQKVLGVELRDRCLRKDCWKPAFFKNKSFTL